MSKITRQAYERHLNDLYKDSYSWGQVIDNFSHMVKRQSTLQGYFDRSELGTLQRKADPIAFNTGYNEWCK